MKHWNEEELIEFYYGESDSPAAVGEHLRECKECAKSYATLSADLFAIRPPATPFRDADYGAETWRSIRDSLPAYAAPKRPLFGWLQLHPWNGLAMAAACLLIIAATFFAGRQWEHRSSRAIGNNGRT